ncbi:MAG: HEAT repeat domain-containing protein, partial [Microcystis aeruginosa G11-06]|nr:HEAT repeat domain-containing protein [Microcystis aeruginosa G11-06]
MIKINEYTKIAVSSLSKKLDDNHPEIRAKAAESLGKIGSETAIPGLLKALEDSDEYVRRKAVEALAKIGSETA